MILGSDAIIISKAEAYSLLVAVFRDWTGKPGRTTDIKKEYQALSEFGALDIVTALQDAVRDDEDDD